MECLICKRRLEVKERVAKIICADLLEDCEVLVYDQLEDEGMIHIDCLKELIQGAAKPSVSQDTSAVERTEILSFLGG